MKRCLACGKGLESRWQEKFCSNKCQADFRYEKFKEKWLDGAKVETIATSGHIKRYLREKFGEKCSQCGWNEKNPVTGRVPVEVDHIDGHFENNSLTNLRLICPNCHSLSPTFRNLNKGNGRTWRTLRLRKLRQ